MKITYEEEIMELFQRLDEVNTIRNAIINQIIDMKKLSTTRQVGFTKEELERLKGRTILTSPLN